MIPWRHHKPKSSSLRIIPMWQWCHAPPPSMRPPPSPACSLLGWGIGHTGCSWTPRRTAWRRWWRRNPRPTERFHRGRKRTPGRRSHTGSTRYWDTKTNQLKQETETRNITVQINDSANTCHSQGGQDRKVLSIAGEICFHQDFSLAQRFVPTATK